MTKAEHDALIAKIEEQARADIAAVQRVYRLTNAHDVVLELPTQTIVVANGTPTIAKPAEQKVAENTAENGPKRGEVRAMVEEAIANIHGPFTYHVVMEVIGMLHPESKPNRTTVSQTLDKMASRNELAVVQKGAGKRATQYAAPNKDYGKDQNS